MKYLRWYDKDPDLSKLLKFIEQLPVFIRDEVAQDLIQIILNDLEMNSDEEISTLGLNNINIYKRWYDHNLDLHSAVEIIKNLSENKRHEIISLLFESIVQIMTVYHYEVNE